MHCTRIYRFRYAVDRCSSTQQRFDVINRTISYPGIQLFRQLSDLCFIRQATPHGNAADPTFFYWNNTAFSFTNAQNNHTNQKKMMRRRTLTVVSWAIANWTVQAELKPWSWAGASVWTQLVKAKQRAASAAAVRRWAALSNTLAHVHVCTSHTANIKRWRSQ